MTRFRAFICEKRRDFWTADVPNHMMTASQMQAEKSEFERFWLLNEAVLQERSKHAM